MMVLVSIASLATLVPPTTSSAACSEEFSINSYRVKATPDSHVYRIGEVARFAVTVTRKDTGEPASDVTVYVGLERDDNWSFGGGRTNSKGKDDVSVKIDREMPAGYATQHAYAYKRQADTVCAIVSEYGYKKTPHAVRIRH
jgi:hypothetical protein